MKTWWQIYSFDASDYIKGSSAALGAEVTVWSEVINNKAEVWPRAAAMADRHWGPKV